MPTKREEAVLLQKSVRRLQNCTAEELEYALRELSCQREKCLRTFIDCNSNWKRGNRLEKERKEHTEMAQLKEEANQKMAVEIEKLLAENEKLIAENQNMTVEYKKMAAENEELHTKNEELTKANRQLQKADDEITQNCRSPLQKRQLPPIADTVVTSTSTSSPSNSKSRITKMPWTPVAKKKLRLTNDENWRPQKLENMNAPTRISDENVHSANLANSRAKHAEAAIVADEELAPLEIVMDGEEEEKEVHPKINIMEPQQALSSLNGTAITISTMMTEVNDHHDSGFMENNTNKQQQDDGDDTHAERVNSAPPPPAPATPPSSPPPSPPPPPPPPLPLPSSSAAAFWHPLAETFARKFCHFLNPFTDLINNYQAFDLEAAIDVYCRYNNNYMDFVNRSPEEIETIKGVLRQFAIRDIEAKKRKQIKEEAATSQMDDF